MIRVVTTTPKEYNLDSEYTLHLTVITLHNIIFSPSYHTQNIERIQTQKTLSGSNNF